MGILKRIRKILKGESSNLLIGFCVIGLVGFVVMLLPLLPFKDKLLEEESIKYWLSFLTFCAFLITIYRQISLESKLDVHNKAILLSNNKICFGLIDDIIRLINSSKTDYEAINVLRERVEVHLEYCQNCCKTELDISNYKKHAEELSRFETQLRTKIKNDKNSFPDDLFIETLREFKRFLIRKDQLISNFK